MKILLFVILVLPIACKKKSSNESVQPVEGTATVAVEEEVDSAVENEEDPGMAVIPVPIDDLPDEKSNIKGSFNATDIVAPNDGTYGEGSSLVFQVQFEDVVDVTGSPSLSIQVGSQTKAAQYTTGSGTAALEFKYLVHSNDSDSDGIELLDFSMNDGQITNSKQESMDSNISSLIPSLVEVLIDSSSPPPNQVSGLAIAPTTSASSLSLTWSVPDGNGSQVSSFLIQYKKVGDSSWTNQVNSSNIIIISGLEEGTQYEFRVAANNGILGAFSDVEQASTFNILNFNPIAWLDATDPNGDGTVPNDGDLVASWTDKTGQASAAEEVNTAQQPVFKTNVINGLPAIRFDDKPVGLQGTFTRTEGTDLTIVIIGQYDEGYTDRCMFEFKGGGNARAFFIDRRYASNIYYNPALTKGGFKLWLIENKGQTAKVYENGDLIFDDVTNFNTDFVGQGNYVLGDDTTGGNRLFGYIGEILIFDQQLSSEDISTLTTYLRNKWSIY